MSETIELSRLTVGSIMHAFLACDYIVSKFAEDHPLWERKNGQLQDPANAHKTLREMRELRRELYELLYPTQGSPASVPADGRG